MFYCINKIEENKMKKIIKLCLVILFTFSYNINIYEIASAQILDVEGIGTCIVGEGENSISKAKEYAHKEALRNAAEHAGVFVVSTSVIKEHRLASDQIEIIANSLLKVYFSDVKYCKTDDYGTQIICTVKATADTDSIERKLTEEIEEIKRKYNEAIQAKKANNEILLNLFNSTKIMNRMPVEEHYNISKNIYEFDSGNKEAREEMLITGVDLGEITEEEVKKYINDYPDDFLGWALLNKIKPNEIYLKKAYELIKLIPEDEYYKNLKPLVLRDAFIWVDDYRFTSKWYATLIDTLSECPEYKNDSLVSDIYSQNGVEVSYTISLNYHPNTDIQKYNKDFLKILDDLYKEDIDSLWYKYIKKNYQPQTSCISNSLKDL